MRVSLLVLLVLASCSPGVAQDGSLPNGYVTDAAGLFSPTFRDSLDARLAALDDSATVQIAVVVLPDVGDRSIEDAALDIARTWRLGQRDVNNGALVLLSMADRQLRIEVGYGLNWQVTDSLAAGIVAEMVPLFRRGAFEAGVALATDRLADRATSVPWRVARTSIRGATSSDVGTVVRLSGKARRGGIETPDGFVRLRFPSQWSQVHAAPTEGAPRQVTVRLTAVDPLAADVLGVDD